MGQRFFFFISLDWPKRLKLWLSVAASSRILIRLEGAVLSFQRQNSKKTKNHNTMYSLIYRAKVLTRNIIGGFPTKAIAVLSFRLLPPLKKTRQKQMMSAPHSEKPLTTKGKNEASIIQRKACHGLKGHSPTRATLGQTTFPTSPYKSG